MVLFANFPVYIIGFFGSIPPDMDKVSLNFSFKYTQVSDKWQYQLFLPICSCACI